MLRALSTILEKKAREGEDTTSMSGASFLSTASLASGGRVDMVVEQLRRALVGRRGAELAWCAPLLEWYVMEEQGAEEVRQVLAEYRDAHPALPAAHAPLLAFLEREYRDEVGLRADQALVAADAFPWSPWVTEYCRLAEQREQEEEGSIASGEGSLDSGEEGSIAVGEREGKGEGSGGEGGVSGVDGRDSGWEGGEASSRGPRAAKVDGVVEGRVDRVGRLLAFLDYEGNTSSREGWALLATSLRSLVLGGQGGRVGGLWGGRGAHWWGAAYGKLRGEEAALVADKGVVAVLLAGPTSPHLLLAEEELERRRAAGEAGVGAMVGELATYRGRALAPCLPAQEEERFDQAFLVDEWKIIGDLNTFRFCEEARSKPAFPNA